MIFKRHFRRTFVHGMETTNIEQTFNIKDIIPTLIMYQMSQAPDETTQNKIYIGDEFKK